MHLSFGADTGTGKLHQLWLALQDILPGEPVQGL
jgi:hypothetical protein